MNKVDNSAQQYISFINVAYECISLLKISGNAPHVVHIARSMNEACISLFPGGLEGLFYSLVEVAEYAESESTIEFVPDGIKNIQKQIKKLTDASILNPGATGDDKTALDTYSIPIITKMMHNPEKSPEFFIELVKTLDELIKKDKLSVCAAGKEISYTTDRPQIMNNKDLSAAVKLANALELPNEFRKQDPLKAWREFIAAMPDKI